MSRGYVQKKARNDRALSNRNVGTLLRRRQNFRPGLLFQNQAVALVGNLAQPCQHAAGARRNEAANDDVFLEAFERVDLALDRGFGENPRGFLERGRRDERTRLQATPS